LVKIPRNHIAVYARKNRLHFLCNKVTLIVCIAERIDLIDGSTQTFAPPIIHIAATCWTQTVQFLEHQRRWYDFTDVGHVKVSMFQPFGDPVELCSKCFHSVACLSVFYLALSSVFLCMKPG